METRQVVYNVEKLEEEKEEEEGEEGEEGEERRRAKWRRLNSTLDQMTISKSTYNTPYLGINATRKYNRAVQRGIT